MMPHRLWNASVYNTPAEGAGGNEGHPQAVDAWGRREDGTELPSVTDQP